MHVTVLLPAADVASDEGYTGITALAASLVTSVGEAGVGLLALLETVIPPIPSEVILPLAGYLSQTGRLDLTWLIIWSTLGSVTGALVLYALGALMGMERAIRVLAATHLVSRADLHRAAEWFTRRGAWSVLVGRMIPGVRSLISLPAGATRMHLAVFCVLTAVGSASWNGLLLGMGAALGTQHDVLDEYLGYVDIAVYAAIVAGVAILALRRFRQHRAGTDG